MRTSHFVQIDDVAIWKKQLLRWSQQFREVVFLDSNQYSQQYSSFDCVLAADALTSLKTDTHNAFEDLKQYQQTTKDWLFGYLTYDLKNDVEAVHSNNFDGLGFPDLYFFQPKKLLLLKGNQLEVRYLMMCNDEIESDLEEIRSIVEFESLALNPVILEQRVSKLQYIDKVNTMLDYIHKGDIYEANFCMEFFNHNATIDPLKAYINLNAISEPPFAAYFKNHKHFLLSASPERFLRKQNSKVISQPIKGTARRSDDAAIDSQIQQQLSNNAKERSENIMIVDLVRNDLARTAKKGSVAVEELCIPYAFKQVHHLISTVVCEVTNDISPVDIIKNAFPMGSMTGAPKISAMNIIEDLEETKRGLYSGALGYFTSEGDFDFNVVIRSILYNSDAKYVSVSVGSAITAEAEAESEYDECLLKAKAMLEVLRKN